MSSGVLYLVPTLLGDMPAEHAIPAGVATTLRRLDYFVAENAKSARAFLKLMGSNHVLQAIDIRELDVNTPEASLGGLLQPILEGRDGGLLSEAGVPAVADPGASLVGLAHRHGIRVVPLVGPSAILLALMASGLDGQRFAFHGYLPKDEGELAKHLRELETRSRAGRQTQIFIETPYRNDRLLGAILASCNSSTRLCIASDVTLQSESIVTRSIADWKKRRPEIGRKPSVFLLLAS
jgi:16S rRNA (cytidine1402-2'-O)-methyltransferase